MSIDIGQVDDADDIIASLNAMLMEEKQHREEVEIELVAARAQVSTLLHIVRTLEDEQ